MLRISSKKVYKREIFNIYSHNYARRGNKYFKIKRLLVIHKALREEIYIEPRIMIFKFDWATTILPQYFDNRWNICDVEDYEDIERCSTNNNNGCR